MEKWSRVNIVSMNRSGEHWRTVKVWDGKGTAVRKWW